MDRRVVGLDDTWERRFDGLDRKVTHLFTWSIGVQVTVLVAVVAALLAR